MKLSSIRNQWYVKRIFSVCFVTITSLHHTMQWSDRNETNGEDTLHVLLIPSARKLHCPAALIYAVMCFFFWGANMSFNFYHNNYSLFTFNLLMLSLKKAYVRKYGFISNTKVEIEPFKKYLCVKCVLWKKHLRVKCALFNFYRAVPIP